ncbi:LysR family transcriptional regulator [Microbulbifer harenosus]|uniref:LysR family transcriptional regulator n=1 Tax=Microbulbifer harenosus TaxID=2576840 RepID=A0ABY2US48_9GAMM|nr:LysR family transcriptional regulator [Microbulbifer harenosus]TLM79370.1 LysR family transcriptional regulator [Microbulbifer harenosus]
MDKDLIALLRVFCAVAEAGSLSAAADRLDVQPPAISKSLARLETLLGKRLFNRTTRAIEITEVGRYVYAEGLKQLLALEALVENVGAFDQAPAGTLTITASSTIGEYLIAPSLADFARQFPQIAVNLLFSNTMLRLPSQNIDIAIRSSQALEDSTLTSRKLFEVARVVVASPTYLERAGTLQEPEEITHHACLNFRHRELYDQWDYVRDNIHHELATRTTYSANSYATLKTLCLTGLGVARLFEYQVKEELKRGELVAIARHVDWGRQSIHAVYHGRLADSPKVQAFLTHFCAQGGQN